MFFLEKAGDGENKWRGSSNRSQDAPFARGYKEKIRRAHENQADFAGLQNREGITT